MKEGGGRKIQNEEGRKIKDGGGRMKMRRKEGR